MCGLFGPKLITPGKISPFTNPDDFRAFYCAGRVIDAHQNPMLIEPLRSCENENIERMGLQPLPMMVNAAPQPPYALIAFAALALVPFPAAVCVWFGFLLVCSMGTVVVIRSFSSIPAIVIAFVIICGNFLAMTSGELGPIVIFAIVLAAWSIARSQNVSAGGFLAVASIAPHLMLSTWISLAFQRRPIQSVLLTVAALLVIPSLILIGPWVWIDYLFKELPSHALSETRAMELQYSLTTLLSFLRIPERYAVFAGQIDYIIMAVIGIVVASRLAKSTNRRELLVLVPPAFVLLGGVFIHLYQFATVFPAAFCLLSSPLAYVRRAMIFVIATILTSMVLDVAFSTALYAPLASHFSHEIQTLPKSDLASVAMKYWNDGRVSMHPAIVIAVVALKVPAIAGILAFVLTTIRAAIFENRGQLIKST